MTASTDKRQETRADGYLLKSLSASSINSRSEAFSSISRIVSDALSSSSGRSLGGGSLFRIYRDARFSKDKRPYKTNTGIQFRHNHGKDVHAPGFYLHLEPSNVFAAVGIWHPDSTTLGKIRDAIIEDPSGWKKAVKGKAFLSRFDLSGDSLLRAPKGYDPDHPFIEDLKRKDFIGTTSLTQDAVGKPEFPRYFAEICQAGTSFIKFLCSAIGLPF